MIQLSGITKRYGTKVAIQDLSFEVLPGRVTGFLGPNGAGKSTTMRVILGLDAPDAGIATVSGRSYRSIKRPLREVGSLLDSGEVHPGRTARAHVHALARANGIGRSRVEEVLGMVGLAEVAGRRVREFSLGMTQRLGIAVALLGDPLVLVLDEPVNGLDPEGVTWIRGLLHSLAREGRTILLSSHLMSEMQNTADHVIVIGQGQLIANEPLASFILRAGMNHVRVKTFDPEGLAKLLVRDGAQVERLMDGTLKIIGWNADEVGLLAARHGIALRQLLTPSSTLEDAFMKITQDHSDYRARDETRGM